MKSLVLYIMTCFLFSVSVAAQQNNSLKGKGFFLNSGKTPAVGVQLSGSIKVSDSVVIKANAVYSANDGSYRLIFPKAEVGNVITLTIGDKEKALQRLEKAMALEYDDAEWLKTDDSMDSLREEQAFKEILEKLEKAQHK